LIRFRNLTCFRLPIHDPASITSTIISVLSVFSDIPSAFSIFIFPPIDYSLLMYKIVLYSCIPPCVFRMIPFPQITKYRPTGCTPDEHISVSRYSVSAYSPKCIYPNGLPTSLGILSYAIKKMSSQPAFRRTEMTPCSYFTFFTFFTFFAFFAFFAFTRSHFVHAFQVTC